ncbi:hypothetical protein BG004_005327 [Podila humilis]|nr:hypothetical protein BG004_005327 [Podila humilis]
MTIYTPTYSVVPESITLRLRSISCPGRHGRSQVRIKLQSATVTTAVSKNLGDHTRESFEFPTTVHNMTFDIAKIDLIDLKAFGHHAVPCGRAYLPLRDLQKRTRAKYDHAASSSLNKPAIEKLNSMDMTQSTAATTTPPSSSSPPSTPTTTTTASSFKSLELSTVSSEFDAVRFCQKHNDVFEIDLPLFKYGSYSKIETSRRRRHSSSPAKISGGVPATGANNSRHYDRSSLDYRPSFVSALQQPILPSMSLSTAETGGGGGIEIGTVTVQATLHFKEQSPDSFLTYARRGSSSRQTVDSGTAMSMTTTTASSALSHHHHINHHRQQHRRNASLDSTASKDSSTLGDSNNNTIKVFHSLPLTYSPTTTLTARQSAAAAAEVATAGLSSGGDGGGSNHNDNYTDSHGVACPLSNSFFSAPVVLQHPAKKQQQQQQQRQQQQQTPIHNVSEVDWDELQFLDSIQDVRRYHRPSSFYKALSEDDNDGNCLSETTSSPCTSPVFSAFSTSTSSSFTTSRAVTSPIATTTITTASVISATSSTSVPIKIITTPRSTASSGSLSSPPPEPRWRLSSWDDWNYVDNYAEGYVDGTEDQELAEDVQKCLQEGRPHQYVFDDKAPPPPKLNQQEEDEKLMADIAASGNKKNNKMQKNKNSSSSSKKKTATITKFGLFSEQTWSAFKDIQLMYTSFFGHGWSLKPSEFWRGFRIVEQFYERQKMTTTKVPFDDIETLERARHFVRLANASYGSLPWVYFGYSFKVAPLNFIRFNSDRKNVMDYFQLKKEDMVVWHFDKRTALVPSYYIIRDPKYNALCIIIRGTFSITDAMTDLVCEYYPYKGGLVHKGIMDNARFILERSGKDIEVALKKFNLNKIYCIGHSLGAGSASLLCSLLQDHFANYNNRLLEIYAHLFAPPPVCTPDLAEAWESSQWSFINENDIACRLSYGNALDLKELIKVAAQASVDPMYDGMSIKDKTEQWMQVVKTAQETIRQVEDIPRLVVSGKIVYMYKCDADDNDDNDVEIDAEGGNNNMVKQRSGGGGGGGGGHGGGKKNNKKNKSAGKTEIRAGLSDGSHFTTIPLRANWLWHHFPQQYDSRIERALESAKRRHRQ